MSAPVWALSLAYWLHMLATVIWIGSLASLSLLILPAAHKTLDPKTYALFIADIQRRYDPLAWFSLVVLAGTGLFQLSSSNNYQGFMNIANSWATAILIKHILVGGMVAISAWMTWMVLPELRRTAIQQASALFEGEPAGAKADRFRIRGNRLLRLNLVLGIFVLALTALARVS